MKNIFALFFILPFFSCSGEHPEGTPPLQVEAGHIVPPLMDSTLSGPPDPASMVKGVTIANLNQYIHPKTGLWLIHSSGAMPKMENTSQVDKNFPIDFSSCKMEALPGVNCESKSFWTKEGCYLQEMNSFKSEKIWTYCGLGKGDEAKVEEAAQGISVTVINTALSARYYFSLIDGKWYLSFVDLRRPCEA